MATDQTWQNEPELAFIRDALVEFCASAQDTRHSAVWAESILGSLQPRQNKRQLRKDPLAANIRTDDLMALVRAELQVGQQTQFDPDIHRKMQAMLAEAFAAFRQS